MAQRNMAEAEASDCLHAVKPDKRLVCAQTGHIKGYLYIMCYRALAMAKAVSFITRAPAFLKTVSDARVRDDARPSVHPSAMAPQPFAVFFASVRDRKTERKSEIDGIDSSRVRGAPCPRK